MTLIEVLVVVGIVGILAAIAVPIYTNYIQRARRADAKTALQQVRGQLRRCGGSEGVLFSISKRTSKYDGSPSNNDKPFLRLELCCRQ